MAPKRNVKGFRMPRRISNSEFANSEKLVEDHVAKRLRLRRGLLGLSQQELGEKLGITFQQIQKYEKGANRISVGKLFRVAEALDVPLSFFFDGLDEGSLQKPRDERAFLGPQEIALLQALRSAPDHIAAQVADLLRAIRQEKAGTPVTETDGNPPSRSEPVPGKVAAAELSVAIAAELPKRRGRPLKSASAPDVSASVAPVVADAPKRLGRPPESDTAAETPKRRGRPPKSASMVAPPTTKPSTATPRPRRARGAVWDPSDIR